MHLPALRVEHEPQQVPAQAALVRRYHREHRGRRDGRVDGIAARAQDGDSLRRRERIARGDHAARGANRTQLHSAPTPSRRCRVSSSSASGSRVWNTIVPLFMM